MSEFRRYSLVAIVLLVILRLGIGWQLLYEGLWKIDTLNTARPWTASGYLKNSAGPMRDTFRDMAGDPDEFGWLDYETVASRWQDWADRFTEHYRLDETQSASLDKLLNGTQSKVGDRMAYPQELKELPLEGKKLESFNKRKSAIWFDAQRQRLYIDANKLLQPDEKASLLALAPKPPPVPKDVDPNDEEAVKLQVAAQAEAVAVQEKADAYVHALNTVYERQKKGLGYFRKLAGAVRGNPELLGEDLQGWEDTQRLGKLEQYREQLAEYEHDYAAATTEFEWDHLSQRWGDLQSLRAELTGPVKAMETELKEKAQALLAVEQHARGPVGKPWTLLRFTDTMTIIGLTALGAMLILGLFTRFAALAAAVMLFSFYLAMPPLPGVPPAPGPEHSLIVNKNLIEVLALLAIAALPSGMWFGVDRLLSAFFSQWRQDGKVSKSRKSMVATGDEPSESPGVATVGA